MLNANGMMLRNQLDGKYRSPVANAVVLVERNLNPEDRAVGIFSRPSQCMSLAKKFVDSVNDSL